MNYTKYGWSEETHFSGFEELEEGVNWELGYGCTGVPLAKPHRNFENVSKSFRTFSTSYKKLFFEYMN